MAWLSLYLLFYEPNRHIHTKKPPRRLRGPLFGGLPRTHYHVLVMHVHLKPNNRYDEQNGYHLPRGDTATIRSIPNPSS